MEDMGSIILAQGDTKKKAQTSEQEDLHSDSPLPFVTTVFLGLSLNLRALVFICKTRVYSVINLCDKCYYSRFSNEKRRL